MGSSLFSVQFEIKNCTILPSNIKVYAFFFKKKKNEKINGRKQDRKKIPIIIAILSL
jgi:hypothetical protein